MDNSTGFELSSVANELLPKSHTPHDLEKAIITYYGIITFIFGTGLNSLVIYLTYKHRQFHTAYMLIRVIYAILDIACIWGMIPVWVLYSYIENMNETLICYFSDFSTGIFQCTMNMTAVVSFERYVLKPESSVHAKVSAQVIVRSAGLCVYVCGI